MCHSADICRAGSSILILVDIQTRLSGAMEESVRSRLLDRAATLAQAASLLEIPTLITRQYPKGLGDTEPDIHTVANGATTIDKTSFSCCGSGPFLDNLGQNARDQIVLAGLESHVCILQTALELQARGKRVFVVEDAICSRHSTDHQCAIQRMRQQGIVVSTTESTLFEWLGDASHPRFKDISRLIR